MTPSTMLDTLALQLSYTHWVVNVNLKDVTEEEHLRSPGGGGNCINWVLGHIVASRNACLTMLGAELVLPKDIAARYKRSSDAIEGDAPANLATLLNAFNQAQDVMLAGLPTLTQETLDAPAAFSPSDNPKETVGSLLTGLLFHEAYHCGQIGVLRRVTGHEGAIR
jgi:uncharacterized damage-inducible protein DinB